ncbi:Ubiquitin carboxyl-terminal hydrolase 22 [Homalodisca vitripennis]|nr:Ubiquitin carboxyl-terminal hydrolase 22 [Homalodisca vitripennis]
MFWGYFTHEGTGALVPVEGMMKSDQYMDICQRRIVPLMQRNPDLIFQQDLAPCHTSKKMKAFFRNQHIEVLSWPGNSPDLNPIENLWAILKKKLGKMDCCRKDELIKSVIRVWFHDEDIKNHCSTLVESMPKRVNELIKNKGGHINY